ncbi:TPA: aminotransferase class I/II-fold pyridoxal phosphate-dependent enzyme [Candidatus Woesearchaeota archaeon]|nr:aminotransferase class I/II-fold pyridoxal phosphate-dependent enzyme [Candidatus Woesearchaeota archaeon]
MSAPREAERRCRETLNAIVGLSEIDLDTIATHIAINGVPQHVDALEQTIARYHHVPESHVLVGSSALALLRGVAAAVGRIAIPVPDYFEFASYGAQSILVQRSVRFALPNVSDLGVSAVLLSNPNNPTGTCHDLRGIVHEITHRNMLLVVDEAYVDFAGEQASIASMVARNENIVVARTFSKCYGMLDDRAAYLLGPPELLHEVRAEPASSSARMRAQSLIGVSLNDVRRDVSMRRAMLRSILAGIGATTARSSANFVMARSDGYHLCERLMDSGVKVRCLDGTPGLEDAGYCRVAVGSYAQLHELERRTRR